MLYFYGEDSMKSNARAKIIILLTIVLLFALLPIITINLRFITSNSSKSSDYRDGSNLDNKNLKLSTVSGKIHIINNSGWVDFRNDGNCTGNGTYADPYVIEDLVIDGGGSGSCILIENSSVYFTIENCTVYNSGGYYYTEMGLSLNAGIKLSHVNNSYIIDNDCSSNWYGIIIEYSDNNTISGNTDNDGILIFGSGNTTISGNIMNHCGLGIYGSLEEISSYEIDTTNLVNGKPLYYYTNEVNLGSDNFTNAGQVILVNCNDSLVSNLNISDSFIGISLHYCNNNNISGNTPNNNRSGISLFSSDYNTVSGNIANNNNGVGISLSKSDYNTVSGNTANNNTGTGIQIEYSDSNTVSENIANDNNWAGIYLSTSQFNNISDNTVNYNYYGIHFYDSDSNTILRNNLVGNDVCIYENEASDSNVFENNDCGEIILRFNLFILIIPAVVIFLIAALINGKKRVCLLFSGTIGVFNIYAIFSLINSFRRDHNQNVSFFPLNYVYYLLLTNVIYTVVALLLIKYLGEFKENRIVQKVQAFFNVARDNIFKIEKKTDIMLSLLLLFCLFYIVGFLCLFIHEFGHSMIAILFDGYYHSFFINIYLQGGAYSVMVIQPSDPLFFVQHTVLLLGGLITESAFAFVSIIILLKKKEKNKFSWLLSIAIMMLFFDRVALYFTFPQLVNFSSDVLAMVNRFNYDPWALFFIFLPFLLVAFYFTYRIILGVMNRYITSFIPFTFY